MNRLLMQHGVGQLEQLFAASKTDAKVLKQLENELRYRQVPRAVALLAEVQSALYSTPSGQKAPERATTGPTTDAPPSDEILQRPPVQPGLWGSPAGQGAEAGQRAATSAPAVTLAPSAPKEASPQSKAAPGREPSQETPMVTLADAYRMFKATASSTWESIEQTRRQAVQASSPTRLAGMSESQKNAARQQATSFNAAYAVLFQARFSSQRTS